jgi:hypothetical protein
MKLGEGGVAVPEARFGHSRVGPAHLSLLATNKVPMGLVVQGSSSSEAHSIAVNFFHNGFPPPLVAGTEKVHPIVREFLMHRTIVC